VPPGKPRLVVLTIRTLCSMVDCKLKTLNFYVKNEQNIYVSLADF